MDARRRRATSCIDRLENGQSFDRPKIKADRVSNIQAAVNLTPPGRDRAEGEEMKRHSIKMILPALAVAAALSPTLSTSVFADEPTLVQRIALARMYDIETVKAHCPFAINFDKIDRDLSKIGMSIADYCPDGRFNEYASPSLNEPLSKMLNRIGSDPTKMCAEASRLYGPDGSDYRDWLKKSRGPPGQIGMVPLCTLDRE
jgi:hypothetical protein